MLYNFHYKMNFENIAVCDTVFAKVNNNAKNEANSCTCLGHFFLVKISAWNRSPLSLSLPSQKQYLR